MPWTHLHCKYYRTFRVNAWKVYSEEHHFNKVASLQSGTYFVSVRRNLSHFAVTRLRPSELETTAGWPQLQLVSRRGARFRRSCSKPQVNSRGKPGVMDANCSFLSTLSKWTFMSGYVEHIFSCCYVFILHVMMDSDNKTQNCTFQFVKWWK